MTTDARNLEQRREEVETLARELNNKGQFTSLVVNGRSYDRYHVLLRDLKAFPPALVEESLTGLGEMKRQAKEAESRAQAQAERDQRDAEKGGEMTAEEYEAANADILEAAREAQRRASSPATMSQADETNQLLRDILGALEKR